MKIGTSQSIYERLVEQLQPLSLVPLVLYALSPGSHGTERGFHARFATHRVRGEIFRVAGDLARWLDHHGLPEPVPLVEPGREISLALNAPNLAATLAAHQRAVQRAVAERRAAYS